MSRNTGASHGFPSGVDFEGHVLFIDGLGRDLQKCSRSIVTTDNEQITFAKIVNKCLSRQSYFGLDSRHGRIERLIESCLDTKQLRHYTRLLYYLLHATTGREMGTSTIDGKRCLRGLWPWENGADRPIDHNGVALHEHMRGSSRQCHRRTINAD